MLCRRLAVAVAVAVWRCRRSYVDGPMPAVDSHGSVSSFRQIAQFERPPYAQQPVEWNCDDRRRAPRAGTHTDTEAQHERDAWWCGTPSLQRHCRGPRRRAPCAIATGTTGMRHRSSPKVRSSSICVARCQLLWPLCVSPRTHGKPKLGASGGIRGSSRGEKRLAIARPVI